MGLIFVGGFFAAESHQKKNDEELIQQVEPQILQIRVDGAVANPGVYYLDEDCRVQDALAAAGGLLPEADWLGLNLAAKLYNLQKLEISYIFETAPGNRSYDDVNIQMETAVVREELERNSEVSTFEATETTDGSPTITPMNSCSEEVIGNGIFVWPTENHFLSGNDYSYSHPGIDIAAGEGAPIYAVDSGMIRLEGRDNSGYGNIIEIDHDNGYSTVYAHLSVIGVKAGQRVCSGQWIGAAGSTGNSTGVHLHFEVLLDGGYVNPWSVLPVP